MSKITPNNAKMATPINLVLAITIATAKTDKPTAQSNENPAIIIIGIGAFLLVATD